MEDALIHRARLVTRTRGERDAEGEYVQTQDPDGPFFAARVMERGGPSSERRRRDNTTDARVAREYELLAGTVAVDEEGTVTPVVLSASDVVETVCAVLDSPTLEIVGKPEKLNDGETFIGWLATAVAVEDAA